MFGKIFVKYLPYIKFDLTNFAFFFSEEQIMMLDTEESMII